MYLTFLVAVDLLHLILWIYYARWCIYLLADVREGKGLDLETIAMLVLMLGNISDETWSLIVIGRGIVNIQTAGNFFNVFTRTVQLLFKLGTMIFFERIYRNAEKETPNSDSGSEEQA